MSIKSELSVLKVNIQNAKDKLYTNLVDKGVTDITTASTLDAMADSVSGITTGGGSEGGNPFEIIGYESIPKYIQDDIDYSQTIYDEWDASITNCTDKFKGDKQLVYFPLVDTSNVTNMTKMFSGCTNLQYVPSLNTSNVTIMSDMFGSCKSLTLLDSNSFDTSNVNNMSSIFYNCTNLTSLDLSNFDTSKVTNMSYMFGNCGSLTSLDLSNFDTSKVTNMSSMFSACSGLTSLDLSNFDTSKVAQTTNMFNGCSGLTEIHWNNFGNGSGYTSVTLNYCSKLGVNTTDYPNAKQSIVNTFVTNSFDRATAGYKSCKITLHANTKAQLTDDEIAAITAKGFTIA